MPTIIARSILLTLLLSSLAFPAFAEVRILASPGGEVGPFLDLFARMRASGERVVARHNKQDSVFGKVLRIVTAREILQHAA